MMEYIIILLLLFRGTYKELTLPHYTNKRLFYLLFVLMWLYSGLRYRVGTDTFMYIELFNYFPDISEFKLSSVFDYSIEPLWIIYNSFLKLFCKDFVIVQLVSSLIFNLAVFKFLKKNTQYVFLALTLYFILDYLLLNCEFMRQTTALGFYYLFVHKYLYRKKYFAWIFGTLICTFMHSTIIICLFFPLVSMYKVSAKQIFIIAFICLVLVLTNQVFTILSSLIPENVSAADKIIAYRDNVTTIFNLNYFITKFYMFFVVLFSMLYHKESKYAGIMTLYLMFIALTATHSIFDRLHYCLCLFYFVFFADVIVKILTKKSKILFVAILLILAIPNIIYFTHHYEGNFYVYNKFFPYYSYLNPQKSKTRENMVSGSQQLLYIFK